MRKVDSGGPKRKADALLDQYTYNYAGDASGVLRWIFIPLITFGAFGLIWSIPFPYLPFLGKFNGFVNWASFVVAFSIYYYYKLSPTLSYGMLLIFGLFSYFIVQLEYWEIDGGLSLWLTCLIIFVVSWVAHFIVNRSAARNVSILTYFNYLLVGPIWFLSRVYKKLNIPY